MKQALLAALSFAVAYLLSVATAPDALAQIDANPIVRNAAYASLTEEAPNNPYGTRLPGTVNWRVESYRNRNRIPRRKSASRLRFRRAGSRPL